MVFWGPLGEVWDCVVPLGLCYVVLWGGALELLVSGAVWSIGAIGLPSVSSAARSLNWSIGAGLVYQDLLVNRAFCSCFGLLVLFVTWVAWSSCWSGRLSVSGAKWSLELRLSNWSLELGVRPGH